MQLLPFVRSTFTFLESCAALPRETYLMAQCTREVLVQQSHAVQCFMQRFRNVSKMARLVAKCCDEKLSHRRFSLQLSHLSSGWLFVRKRSVSQDRAVCRPRLFAAATPASSRVHAGRNMTSLSVHGGPSQAQMIWCLTCSNPNAQCQQTAQQHMRVNSPDIAELLASNSGQL